MRVAANAHLQNPARRMLLNISFQAYAIVQYRALRQLVLQRAPVIENRGHACSSPMREPPPA